MTCINRTLIEWVLNHDNTQGYTWNPLTGCHNHIYGICKGGGFPCYAYRLANGRLKTRYLANPHTATKWWKECPIDKYEMQRTDPFYPRLWPERIAKFFQGNEKAKGIFVCDMGELFGDWVPQEWQEMVFTTIKAFPQHRFYLLTKQPQNLVKFSPFPPNCWVGITVCTNGMMASALQHLSMIEAKVKFISFEPLLGMIGMDDHMSMKGIVDWVIIGVQTKPYKPPKIEWVQEIVEAADKACIPVFLKDNLKPLIDEHFPDEGLTCNHDRTVRSPHPFFCKNCDASGCDQCGVIWNLRQEMPV